MARTFTVSDSIVIDADASTIYRQVSNPSLMGRWSPENCGATVRDDGEQAYVGMVFDGSNKRGALRWTTRCTVTAADPAERFAFRVHAIGKRRPVVPGRIASWEYRFEVVDGGTLVTETWTDDRRSWPDFLAHAFDKAATRGQRFADFQRGNIRTTLRNLKTAMEQTAG
ncbi:MULTISPECIES: SRPBCC family protein [unclassified Streptomyces]|uniref:SRPBCC family protein n=1 Tax=unclassified Streptomyces TaxID=2593676 RepID=UPI002DDC216E|nr:SRPBCC family protein [Streptomyces sp. NBC_01750]WSA98541.1 SRPBCC family protein [Streptomyces sp. NBC_01794]WSD36923.1 SRPBCC family protein [Streptomyces sp. NBC_01750]